MNEFKNYHPIVNFIYFLFVIGFSMVFMHPVFLLISFLCAFTYSVLLKGQKAIKTNLAYMLPMVIITAVINPVFNHEGATIICYLPGSNPLTYESIVYGLCAAFMLINVICWFSCYNEVMTSDKFIYLFGRIIPSLSLIFSMVLRFVPEFSAQFKKVAEAQRSFGRDISEGGIIKRVKNGLLILSIMTTWALENSIETADSMKARGYGLPGRTAFSIFIINKRDICFLIYILLLGIYIITGSLMGQIEFSYFPYLKGADLTVYNQSIFLSYFLLCISPVIIEIREAKKWKLQNSKI